MKIFTKVLADKSLLAIRSFLFYVVKHLFHITLCFKKNDNKFVTVYLKIIWIGLSRVLRPHQQSIGYFQMLIDVNENYITVFVRKFASLQLHIS